MSEFAPVDERQEPTWCASLIPEVIVQELISSIGMRADVVATTAVKSAGAPTGRS